MTELKKVDFSKMADRWPSPFIARGEVEKFTGGIVNPRYLANLDSAGKGPSGRFRVGRKIAYPVVEFLAWLENRTQAVD